VKALLDAEKQGPAAVQAIIDKLQGALDQAKEIDDELGGLGIKSHDELQHAADIAREAYEKVAEGVKTGQYTAEDAEKAYRAFQQALADMGDEAAKAWLKAHKAAEDATDAVNDKMTAAESELTDLLNKRKSLADSIAQEADEPIKGVIQTKQEADLKALDAQIQEKADKYAELADETGQEMKDAIVKALKEIRIDPIHIGVVLTGGGYTPPNGNGGVAGGSNGGTPTGSGGPTYEDYVRDYWAPDREAVLAGMQHAAHGGIVGQLQRFAGGGRVSSFSMPSSSFAPPVGPDNQLVWTMPGELIMNEAQQGGIAQTLMAASQLARNVSMDPTNQRELIAELREIRAAVLSDRYTSLSMDSQTVGEAVVTRIGRDKRGLKTKALRALGVS
jgi:hypothetical protein